MTRGREAARGTEPGPWAGPLARGAAPHARRHCGACCAHAVVYTAWCPSPCACAACLPLTVPFIALSLGRVRASWPGTTAAERTAARRPPADAWRRPRALPPAPAARSASSMAAMPGAGAAARLASERGNDRAQLGSLSHSITRARPCVVAARRGAARRGGRWGGDGLPASGGARAPQGGEGPACVQAAAAGGAGGSARLGTPRRGVPEVRQAQGSTGADVGNEGERTRRLSDCRGKRAAQRGRPAAQRNSRWSASARQTVHYAHVLLVTLPSCTPPLRAVPRAD